MNLIVPTLVADMRERYPDAAALFSWTVERLEEAYGREPVRLWCSYLAVGRTGMSSRELSDLLARTLGGDASRVALRIERAIRRYPPAARTAARLLPWPASAKPSQPATWIDTLPACTQRSRATGGALGLARRARAQ